MHLYIFNCTELHPHQPRKIKPGKRVTVMSKVSSTTDALRCCLPFIPSVKNRRYFKKSSFGDPIKGLAHYSLGPHLVYHPLLCCLQANGEKRKFMTWNLYEIEISVSIYKILLGRCHAHSFTCCLWHSYATMAELISFNRLYGLQRPYGLKFWLSGHLYTVFADPWSNSTNSNSNYSF